MGELVVADLHHCLQMHYIGCVVLDQSLECSLVPPQILGPENGGIVPAQVGYRSFALQTEVGFDLLQPSFVSELPGDPTKINVYRRQREIREQRSKESQIESRPVEGHYD